MHEYISIVKTVWVAKGVSSWGLHPKYTNNIYSKEGKEVMIRRKDTKPERIIDGNGSSIQRWTNIPDNLQGKANEAAYAADIWWKIKDYNRKKEHDDQQDNDAQDEEIPKFPTTYAPLGLPRANEFSDWVNQLAIFNCFPHSC